MDYEALRRQADLRLSQELTRIRNLPKRSKIKMVNTYGLKHASHTNAGLLQGLHTNLSIINREQRRVVNDMNKRRRDFALYCQRASLPPTVFPPLANCEGPLAMSVKKRKISDRTKPDASILLDRKQTVLEMTKKDRLVAMAERSKTKTFGLIRANRKKFDPVHRLSPINDKPSAALDDSFVTHLVNRRRVNPFKSSCFPSLLTGQSQVDDDSIPNPRRQSKPRNSQQEPSHTPPGGKPRGFRRITFEKVLKKPDPRDIPFYPSSTDPKLHQITLKAKTKQ